jgi:A/G-specific adenine glycosylase
MELGGVACEKTPSCDAADCPWRQWCHAYETGDFTAPDVPSQPEFEGSRRQMRGRVISILKDPEELEVDALGPRVRVDYVPDSDGEGSREWLLGLLEDLEDDGLVDIEEREDETVATLQK